MNASVRDDLEQVLYLDGDDGDDGSQALRESHVHDTSMWNPNVPPSTSLEASAFDPLNLLLVPDHDGIPDDDYDAFPAFGSMPALFPSPQQQNVNVPPVAARYAAPAVSLTPVSMSAAGQAEHDEVVVTTHPVSTDGDAITLLTNPWTNPEYQSLIQWVTAAADADLVKPFKATVPPHLKPPSWKGFRKDDTKCKVNLGKDLGRATETRLVLDAKNLFMYIQGKQKKWFFMCPNCKRLGHSKSGKDAFDEQFMSLSRSYPDRQYLVLHAISHIRTSDRTGSWNWACKRRMNSEWTYSSTFSAITIMLSIRSRRTYRISMSVRTTGIRTKSSRQSARTLSLSWDVAFLHRTKRKRRNLLLRRWPSRLLDYHFFLCLPVGRSFLSFHPPSRQESVLLIQLPPRERERHADSSPVDLRCKSR